jgi:alpha-glucuronidase
MALQGYVPVEVKPWEAASGGKAISCAEPTCAATTTYRGPAGWHRLRIRYFDQNNGAAEYRVFIGAQLIAAWRATGNVPTQKLDTSSSALNVIESVWLAPGDTLRIEGSPDRGELAALDYVDIEAK